MRMGVVEMQQKLAEGPRLSLGFRPTVLHQNCPEHDVSSTNTWDKCFVSNFGLFSKMEFFAYEKPAGPQNRYDKATTPKNC
jgi:hypothetical protein